MISNADYRLPAIDQSEQSEQPNNLPLVLKSWPLIALLTIGLCYLTQLVAGWFGIELPDQANIDLVRRYAGWNWNFVLLCAQVLVLMPAIEELIFRLALFKGIHRLATRKVTNERIKARVVATAATLSAALFSAAHYIAQPFPDAAFLALFFFGLAQCWLYRRTDRLWCAMLNHGLFNLTNLVLLFVLPQA